MTENSDYKSLFYLFCVKEQKSFYFRFWVNYKLTFKENSVTFNLEKLNLPKKLQLFCGGESIDKGLLYPRNSCSHDLY